MNLATLKNWLSNEKKSWPTWWASLSTRRKFGPTLAILVYWILLIILGATLKVEGQVSGGLNPDHIAIGSLIIFLSLAGRTGGIVLKFIFPFLLTGILYDTMRYYSGMIRAEIQVAFPYEFDKKFFGIVTSAGRLTPNEFLQLHIHPLLDLVTGFFYLCFIAIYIGISVFHVFVLPKKLRSMASSFLSKSKKSGTLSTTDASKNSDYQNSEHQNTNSQLSKAERLGPYVTWAFFWVNMLGYSTYYWFPAAPPWYVADHGLGPAKLDVAASAAGAIRFDELLGTHFFTGMYGRAADVFGAIPSLHVAYPLLSTLFAFQLGSLRVFSVFFYFIMCFSAVYLNHHYILDILWGSTYAVFIFCVMNWLSKRKKV